MPLQARLQQLADAIPAPSADTQINALSVLCWGVAAMAFVSLNPYFMWGYQKTYYAVASLLLIVSFSFCWRLLSFSNQRIVLMLGFSLFLAYLSFLPKIEGGVTRWFLLIPLTVVLLALRRETLTKAFGIFYWIFAISLIPGMILWIWVAAGLPVEFTWMTPPSDIIQRGVIDYFAVPGAIVLPSNAKLLPNGGTLFRLCGIYDEPGTVGTIAALFLAATRYRLRDIRGTITFVAGLMSFSVAFAILTTIGLIAIAILQSRARLIAAAAISAVFGSTILGWIPDDTTAGGPTPRISVSGESSVDLAKYGLDQGTRLRFSSVFDNRAHPKMRSLLDEYVQSSFSTLLFGIASNASNVRSAGSSVWYMVLTNYGLVGFVWLFILFFLPLLTMWRTKSMAISTAIFCMIFLLSFYQRPIIWMPAQLLLYFAGIWCVTKTQRPEG